MYLQRREQFVALLRVRALVLVLVAVDDQQRIRDLFSAERNRASVSLSL